MVCNWHIGVVNVAEVAVLHQCMYRQEFPWLETRGDWCLSCKRVLDPEREHSKRVLVGQHYRLSRPGNFEVVEQKKAPVCMDLPNPDYFAVEVVGTMKRLMFGGLVQGAAG